MSGPRQALDEPPYLTVIPIIGRIAATYFAVVAAALLADVTIVHGAAFRTWPAFGAQAAVALALGLVVIRGELRRLNGDGGSGRARSLVPPALIAAGVMAGGFFPDRLGYSRRAPEPFARTLLAIVPAAVAAWLIVRAIAPRPIAPSATVQEQGPPLTGTAP